MIDEHLTIHVGYIVLVSIGILELCFPCPLATKNLVIVRNELTTNFEGKQF